MKRVIRANTNSVIFEDEFFVFKTESGIGRNDTPWEGLVVKSKPGSLAEVHVVEVRLNTTGWPNYEGEPIKHQYSDAYVAHGMGMAQDTWEDTEDYIYVLEDALDFAKRVTEWIRDNGWGK